MARTSVSEAVCVGQQGARARERASKGQARGEARGREGHCRGLRLGGGME